MARWTVESDEALVLGAAQRGDREAQSVLFARYRDRVARQVMRMVGNSAAVDDLVQEVFIRAFTTLPRLRGDVVLRNWLFTIAVNKVRNWEDSRRRQLRREERAIGELPDDPECPVTRLEHQEHLVRFYAALGALPHRQREAFVARAIDGMSLIEAAAALSRPVSTVSYQTRCAEQTLRAALGIRGSDASMRVTG